MGGHKAWSLLGYSVPPASANKPHQKQHHGDDQNNPGEVPKSVATDHPQQPEDDQDNRNGFQHVDLLLWKEPAKCRFLPTDNGTLL